MGKAADNERIRLRATYLNNISVALYVAGGILPLMGYLAKAHQHSNWWLQATATEWNEMLALIVASGLAVAGAVLFRRSADREIQKILD